MVIFFFRNKIMVIFLMHRFFYIWFPLAFFNNSDLNFNVKIENSMYTVVQLIV